MKKTQGIIGVGNSCWLAPWEKAKLIDALVQSEGDLLKWSNSRDLPLKMGGFTDVYINLRNARNDPKVLQLLTEAYSNPLRRLGAKRFVEIPHAVSCYGAPVYDDT